MVNEREEFCRRLRVLDGMRPTEWYPLADIVRRAGDYGVTSIFLGSKSHASLIVKVKDGEVVEYDPLDGELSDGIDINTYEPIAVQAYFTGNLNDLFDLGVGFAAIDLGNVQNLRQVLNIVDTVDGGYELEGMDSLGRIQGDGCNCAPLSLYAAIIGNVNTPKYAGRLDREAILRDTGLRI